MVASVKNMNNNGSPCSSTIRRFAVAVTVAVAIVLERVIVFQGTSNSVCHRLQFG